MIFPEIEHEKVPSTHFWHVAENLKNFETQKLQNVHYHAGNTTNDPKLDENPPILDILQKISEDSKLKNYKTFIIMLKNTIKLPKLDEKPPILDVLTFDIIRFETQKLQNVHKPA